MRPRSILVPVAATVECIAQFQHKVVHTCWARLMRLGRLLTMSRNPDSAWLVHRPEVIAVARPELREGPLKAAGNRHQPQAAFAVGSGQCTMWIILCSTKVEQLLPMATAQSARRSVLQDARVQWSAILLCCVHWPAVWRHFLDAGRRQLHTAWALQRAWWAPACLPRQHLCWMTMTSTCPASAVAFARHMPQTADWQGNMLTSCLNPKLCCPHLWRVARKLSSAAERLSLLPSHPVWVPALPCTASLSLQVPCMQPPCSSASSTPL